MVVTDPQTMNVGQTWTFAGEPTPVKRARRTAADAEKVIGYSGVDPAGNPQTANAYRGPRSLFTLTDMGEFEEPKFKIGQKVQFGRRGPRTVERIRLTPGGWEYYVPLDASPHGDPYGNKYPQWRREAGIAATSS